MRPEDEFIRLWTPLVTQYLIGLTRRLMPYWAAEAKEVKITLNKIGLSGQFVLEGEGSHPTYEFFTNAPKFPEGKTPEDLLYPLEMVGWETNIKTNTITGYKSKGDLYLTLIIPDKKTPWISSRADIIMEDTSIAREFGKSLKWKKIYKRDLPYLHPIYVKLIYVSLGENYAKKLRLDVRKELNAKGESYAARLYPVLLNITKKYRVV